MSDQITVHMDEEVVAQLRDYCEEEYGQTRFVMGDVVETALRQYFAMDEMARVEKLLEDMAPSLSQSELERERQSPTSRSDTSTDPVTATSTETDRKVAKIAADLPENARITEAMVETAIEDHAGASYKTLKKYKNLLVKRGKLFEDPVEPDGFIVGKRKMAMVMETAEDVTITELNDLLGRYDGVLPDDWYLDALPDEYLLNQDLRYSKLREKFGDLELDAPTVSEYCDKNGLSDPSRGFS